MTPASSPASGGRAKEIVFNTDPHFWIRYVGLLDDLSRDVALALDAARREGAEGNRPCPIHKDEGAIVIYCATCREDARKDGAREAWKAAANIAETFVEAIAPLICTDTAGMWRREQPWDIARALRARAAALAQEAPHDEG